MDAEVTSPDETGIRDFLTYRLARLQARLNAQATRLLDEVAGLSLTQWRVVSMIGPENRSTLSEIARRTGIDKGQLSRALKRLIADGVVAREADDADLRLARLHLTGKGRDIFRRTLPVMRRRQAVLLGTLDPGERAAVFSAIDKLSQAARQTEFAT